MDGQKFESSYLQEIGERFNQTPANQTYLEGFAAGVHVANLLETATGQELSDACDLYRRYHEILSVVVKGSVGAQTLTGERLAWELVPYQWCRLPSACELVVRKASSR